MRAVDRTEALRLAASPDRVSAAGREYGAYTRFCADAGVVPSPEAVPLYLTWLLEEGRVHGRGLRYRLQLLDVHARLSGGPVPSQNADLRLYLRGLHRRAALASPETGITPLHKEAVHSLVQALFRPQLSQLRDAALLVLAAGTRLPAQVLRDLRWDQVRFNRDSVVVTVPDPPARSGRTETSFILPATGRSTCPRASLLAWRRAAGPSNGPVFGMSGRPADVGRMRPVLALLGPARTIGRLREPSLARAVAETLAPGPQAVRDRALVLIAFHAALGTDEAAALRQGDVRCEPRGIFVRLAGRREPVTPVPRAAGSRFCPAEAWEDWQELLCLRGLVECERPAFPKISWGSVTSSSMAAPGLNLLVHRACEAAGLTGTYSFTSLRSGFIRSAVRAGVPEHVLARHVGLERLNSVGTHVDRELLLSSNAAALVGL